jgi:hypothetical protein
MKKAIQNIRLALEELFLSQQFNRQKLFVILLIAGVFLLTPQVPLNDWELITSGYWSNFPDSYLKNPGTVYPPWGYILLLPYYLMRAAGARFFSVLAVGWLTHKRGWPLATFLAIVLSPYFIWSMTESSADILVIVLPIVLWEFSKGRKLEIVARGISLAFLLVKPQCTILLIPYLLWTNRKAWKACLWETGIAFLFILPISLIGSPPLVVQWINNLVNPTSQNLYYWSINNISLTEKFSFWIAVGCITLAGVCLYFLYRIRLIAWGNDQTISSLLMISMFLVPYTSHQSVASGLAFIPSWFGLLYQWLGIFVGALLPGFENIRPQWTFSACLISLILFSLVQRRKEKSLQAGLGNQQPDP